MANLGVFWRYTYADEGSRGMLLNPIADRGTDYVAGHRTITAKLLNRIKKDSMDAQQSAEKADNMATLIGLERTYSKT